MSLVDNPYRNRKAVADPALFCGRQSVLLLIADNIRHRQMCAIAGEPLNQFRSRIPSQFSTPRADGVGNPSRESLTTLSTS